MNAVERIEAAIQKLEVLKSDCTQGEWWPTGTEVFAGTGLGGDVLVVENGRAWADPRLIVVLYRTIDAQIRVLGEGKREYYRYGSIFPTDVLNAALALADAILGDAS